MPRLIKFTGDVPTYYARNREKILQYERDKIPFGDPKFRRNGGAKPGIGRCEICWGPETVKSRSGKVRALAQDYNHKTEKLRGRLCMRCNMMVGYIETHPNGNEPNLLYRMLGRYLRKFGII